MIERCSLDADTCQRLESFKSVLHYPMCCGMWPTSDHTHHIDHSPLPI